MESRSRRLSKPYEKHVNISCKSQEGGCQKHVNILEMSRKYPGKSKIPLGGAVEKLHFTCDVPNNSGNKYMVM